MLSHRLTGAGPAVVLLHAVGLDGTFWGVLPERLAAFRTVVAVDLLGHGGSPDAPRPGRMAAQVDSVAALVERLGLGRPTVLGLSFGGMVAQQLALARPDLVGALVLAATPGRIAPEAREAILKRGADAEADGMDAVVAATLERWFTPAFRASEPALRVAGRLRADHPSNWAAAWEAVAEHDALDRLSAVAVPALVVAGEDDAATPLAAEEALANALSARLAVVPAAPHMLQIERADEFAEIVAGFVADTGGIDR